MGKGGKGKGRGKGKGGASSKVVKKGSSKGGSSKGEGKKVGERRGGGGKRHQQRSGRGHKSYEGGPKLSKKILSRIDSAPKKKCLDTIPDSEFIVGAIPGFDMKNGKKTKESLKKEAKMDTKTASSLIISTGRNSGIKKQNDEDQNPYSSGSDNGSDDENPNNEEKGSDEDQDAESDNDGVEQKDDNDCGMGVPDSIASDEEFQAPIVPDNTLIVPEMQLEGIEEIDSPLIGDGECEEITMEQIMREIRRAGDGEGEDFASMTPEELKAAGIEICEEDVNEVELADIDMDQKQIEELKKAEKERVAAEKKEQKEKETKKEKNSKKAKKKSTKDEYEDYVHTRWHAPAMPKGMMLPAALKCLDSGKIPEELVAKIEKGENISFTSTEAVIHQREKVDDTPKEPKVSTNTTGGGKFLRDQILARRNAGYQKPTKAVPGTVVPGTVVPGTVPLKEEEKPKTGNPESAGNKENTDYTESDSGKLSEGRGKKGKGKKGGGDNMMGVPDISEEEMGRLLKQAAKQMKEDEVNHPRLTKKEKKIEDYLDKSDADLLGMNKKKDTRKKQEFAFGDTVEKPLKLDPELLKKMDALKAGKKINEKPEEFVVQAPEHIRAIFSRMQQTEGNKKSGEEEAFTTTESKKRKKSKTDKIQEANKVFLSEHDPASSTKRTKTKHFLQSLY